MPMYPYGGESENAPAAGMGESGGSNEAIPSTPAGNEPTAKGFPLPGEGFPEGIFDSHYAPSGRTWVEPGESGSGPTNWGLGDPNETVQNLPTVAPPKARPATG